MSSGWSRKSAKRWRQLRRRMLTAKAAGWRIMTTTRMPNVAASHSEEKSAIGSFMSAAETRRRSRPKRAQSRPMRAASLGLRRLRSSAAGR
jgi:hypothetical protein